MPILEVKSLKMHYRLDKQWVRAVDDVSFALNRNETLGIVGESGCGKTSLALTLMRLLPPNASIVGGEILFDGVNLLDLAEDQMRQVRLKKISLIFQSAMSALDPVCKIGDFLAEGIRAHENISKKEARERVVELFKLVRLPPSRIDAYPHEFSGGMKQRAIIAMSLLCNPSLVIADEMTTALDVVVQDHILQEIKNLQKKLNFALIIISHDIAVIAETSQKMAVMYGGKIFEYGDTTTVFRTRHPYTLALTTAFPSIRGPLKRLTSLTGSPPNLATPFSGCLFQPRCSFAKEICKKEKPSYKKMPNGHYYLCHFAEAL